VVQGGTMFGGQLDDVASFDLLDAVLGLGGTLIDTAHVRRRQSEHARPAGWRAAHGSGC
jgi:aryl-alcohol dehydrogenase-like predicted oxidoreductase